MTPSTTDKSLLMVEHLGQTVELRYVRHWSDREPVWEVMRWISGTGTYLHRGGSWPDTSSSIEDSVFDTREEAEEAYAVWLLSHQD